MKRNTQPPTVRLNPFLGVEHHRRAQTAQANFRPGVVLVPGQQRYAQTGEAAKKNYVLVEQLSVVNTPSTPLALAFFLFGFGQPHMRHLTLELCSADTLNAYTWSRVVFALLWDLWK